MHDAHGLERREVDRRRHLRRGARVVDEELVALLGYLGVKDDRLAADAVVVAVVLELGRAVGPLGDLRPRRRLAVGEQPVEVCLQGLGAVGRRQLAQPGLAGGQRGDLGVDVGQQHVGVADVQLQQLPQRLVRLAAVVELERRDAQALLVDLRVVESHAAGHAPADVGVVRFRCGVAEQHAVHEDRLHNVDVVQVRAAVVRVIDDVDVTRLHLTGEGAEDLPEHRRDGAQGVGLGDRDGDQLALGIAEGAEEVLRVLDELRGAGALEGEGHLVDDGLEVVLDDFHGDRIEAALLPHGVVPWRAELGRGRRANDRRRPARRTLPPPGRRGQAGRRASRGAGASAATAWCSL